MNFQAFIQKLDERLKLPLPGEEAQLRMAPDGRLTHKEYYSSISNPRQSAILICIYPREDIAHTVLIRRPDKQGIHSGQISFPGGSYDDETDRDLQSTALREAEEEIGIKKEDVKIIGKTTPLIIPVSGFHVQPFIGVLNRSPVLYLNKNEVRSVIEMEFGLLFNPKIKQRDQFLTGTGLVLSAPYYEIAGHKVWGATAMMLSELEAIIR
ncbi:MAG: CoA pyrophosphatase [Chitinophagales bacterium]|nr:CoA pyrophosphatase [Chitinophagales bacterium]